MIADSYGKPLVIGAPRSGFTLLINVIDACIQLNHFEQKFSEIVHSAVITTLGRSIEKAVETGFARFGITKQLLFSPSFRTTLGGPHWIDDRDSQYFCYRKYIGVRGLGDFALLIRYPWEVNCAYPIEHSHYHPERWLSDERFNNYIPFASIRNPLDIVSSSCFSINALTSEYIQRFLSPRKDNDKLRQKIALYKFTDLRFFKGLIRKLRAYYLEYMDCRDDFHEMRWENLIGVPGKTISNIAAHIGISISDEDAADIWTKLAYKNLTDPHQHNYRKGEAYVNGWRKSLTNLHLDIMREEGLEDISIGLGYGKFIPFSEKGYTPYQKKISAYLKKGKVCKPIRDKDLFKFSFNKSNIDASQFAELKTYPWKNHTRIEQSCFSDETMLETIWRDLDSIVSDFNLMLKEVVHTEISKSTRGKKISAILYKYSSLINAAGFDSVEECCNKIIAVCEEKPAPRLIKTIGTVNVVLYDSIFWGIPQSLGPIDLAKENLDQYDAIKSAGSLSDLLKKIPNQKVKHA